MDEGKIYNLSQCLENTRFIQTEELWSASILNQMIIRAQGKPICPTPPPIPSPPFPPPTHSNGPTHGSFQPCDHNLQFHTWLSANGAGCMNSMGQAHPIQRFIIHCSHFPREIHFFQEVIQKALNAYFLPAGARGGLRETAGAGGYGNLANRADKKKKRAASTQIACIFR